MLPARSDSKVVDLATHSYLDDMMKAGVKILFYMPGFLHSKLLIIDDMLSVIGSANMDFRSFEHNFEVNAFVYDGEFTARMASVFEEDQSRQPSAHPGRMVPPPPEPPRRRIAHAGLLAAAVNALQPTAHTNTPHANTDACGRTIFPDIRISGGQISTIPLRMA